MLYYTAGQGRYGSENGDVEGVVWRLKSAWVAESVDSPSPVTSPSGLLPAKDFPRWRRSLEEEGYWASNGAGRSPVSPFDAALCLGLAVPAEGSCPGFLALLSDDDVPWEKQDIVALQTVAAAFSNTSAREALFRQVESTLSETDALYRGSAALSEARTYDAILEALLQHTVLGEGSQRATLELFDRPWAEATLPELYARRPAEEGQVDRDTSGLGNRGLLAYG